MDNLALARWQFGITTVYHFLLVPLSIGLSVLVAVLQTFWYRTGDDGWYRLTKFFGKLLMIGFALGVATGIVQEFQFGMNWSDYSRYVGDIFGAPLAMEAFGAFFIESTFIGVWLFGWGRLSRGAHLLMIWLVAFAMSLSAFFILAANSFLQYPRGARVNPASGRAEMTSPAQMLFSDMSLSTFWHTASTSFMVAGTFVAGIAVWWMVKAARAGDEDQAVVWRNGAYVGLVTLALAGISIIASGHHAAVLMTKIQPTKMAAAEALCATPPEGEGAGFTVAAFGRCVVPTAQDPDGFDGTRIITVPGLLSFLAHSDSRTTVDGAEATFGDDDPGTGLNQELATAFPEVSEARGGDFLPSVMPVFWSFRLMIAMGTFSMVLAAWGLFALRRGAISDSLALGRLAILSIPTPFIASSFGWVFTEMGRQPWIVAPLYEHVGTYGPDATGAEANTFPSLATQVGVSPTAVVSPHTVLISLVGFTFLYLVLAVAWLFLTRRYAAEGLNMNDFPTREKTDLDPSRPLSFSY